MAIGLVMFFQIKLHSVLKQIQTNFNLQIQTNLIFSKFYFYNYFYLIIII